MDENEAGTKPENPPSTSAVEKGASTERGVNTGQKHHAREKISEHVRYVQNKWKKGWERWETYEPMVKFTALLVLFTAIYANISLWQGYQTREAVKVARDALRISERAYVGIDKMTINWDTRDLFISLRNTGKVPAERVKIEIRSAHLGTAPRGHAQVLPSLPTGDVQVCPGPPTYRVSYSLINLTGKQLEDVKNQKRILRIDGSIKYNDGFSKESQSTPFCFSYAPELAKEEWPWLSCGAIRGKDLAKDREWDRNRLRN